MGCWFSGASTDDWSRIFWSTSSECAHHFPIRNSVWLLCLGWNVFGTKLPRNVNRWQTSLKRDMKNALVTTADTLCIMWIICYIEPITPLSFLNHSLKQSRQWISLHLPGRWALHQIWLHSALQFPVALLVCIRPSIVSGVGTAVSMQSAKMHWR